MVDLNILQNMMLKLKYISPKIFSAIEMAFLHSPKIHYNSLESYLKIRNKLIKTLFLNIKESSET